MKKVAAIFITALVLSLAGTVCVSAADLSTANAKAEVLKYLNLFKGSDAGLELERAPTRIESLVSLIRLCGNEKAALDGAWEHPFTDIGEWADSYVGMAYETGIIKGISQTEFGADETATAQQFVTFALRALGYSDTEGDFGYETAIDFGKQTGIVEAEININRFLRADMVAVSYRTLFTSLKDSGQTLSQKLQQSGVFTAEEMENADALFKRLTAPAASSNADTAVQEENKEAEYDEFDIYFKYTNNFIRMKFFLMFHFT